MYGFLAHSVSLSDTEINKRKWVFLSLSCIYQFPCKPAPEPITASSVALGRLGNSFNLLSALNYRLCICNCFELVSKDIVFNRFYTGSCCRSTYAECHELFSWLPPLVASCVLKCHIKARNLTLVQYSVSDYRPYSDVISFLTPICQEIVKDKEA